MKPQQPIWLAIRFPHFYLEAMGSNFKTQEKIMVNHEKILWDFSLPLEPYVVLGSPTTTAQLLANAKQLELDTVTVDTLTKKLLYLFYQFTPYIEPYQCRHPCGVIIRGFFLELSQCLALFKGLANLLGQIIKIIEKEALTFRFGLAHNQQAAWVLSYGPQQIPESFNKKQSIKKLKALPIDLMHEYYSQIEILQSMGFVVFHDIEKQIKKNALKSFRKRFDTGFCDCLEEIFDDSINDVHQISLFEKPRKTFLPEIFFHEEIQFDIPVHASEQLAHPIKLLLQQLTEFLKRYQLQTQSIELHLMDIYQNINILQVKFDRLYQDWHLPFELSMIQLDNQALPFEVDTLVLVCLESTSVDLTQRTLDLAEKNSDIHASIDLSEFQLTTARIIARLGQENIFKYACMDSHVPEYAVEKKDFYQTVNNLPKNVTDADRPAWLLPTPEPIKQMFNGSLYWYGALSIIQGPERIQSHWWDNFIARDYFVAQRSDFVRLWIFNDLIKENWFVHGIFA